MYMLKIQNEDLVHYGVLGMHWGVRRYQPYSVKPRGSGEKGKEVGEAAKAFLANRRQKKFNKAQRKIARIDRKFEKAEKKSQKQFAKAEKKTISPFATQFGVDLALDRAIIRKRVANKYAYKGKTIYEKTLKKYPDMTLDSSTVEKGMKYLNRVTENSTMLYQHMLDMESFKKRR